MDRSTTDELVFSRIRQLVEDEKKVLVIMRGLPGSGKSTLARKIAEVSEYSSIRSADSFFSQGGVYRFDVSRLPDAHEFNKKKVGEDMTNGCKLVIVDNTNTERSEMLPYAEFAVKKGYKLIIVEPNTTWRRNVRLCADRNTHGVPVGKLQAMLDRFEDVTAESLLRQCGGENATHAAVSMTTAPAGAPRTSNLRPAAGTAPTSMVRSDYSWSAVCSKSPTSLHSSQSALAAVDSQTQKITAQLQRMLIETGIEVEESVIADGLNQCDGDADQAYLALLEVFGATSTTKTQTIPAFPSSEPAFEPSSTPSSSGLLIASGSSGKVYNDITGVNKTRQSNEDTARAYGDTGSNSGCGSSPSLPLPATAMLELSRDLVSALFRTVLIDLDNDLDIDNGDLRIPITGALECALRDLVLQNVQARLQRDCATSVGAKTNTDANPDGNTDSAAFDCDSASDDSETSSTYCVWRVVPTYPAIAQSPISIEGSETNYPLHNAKGEASTSTNHLDQSVYDQEYYTADFAEVLEIDISHALVDKFDAVAKYCHAFLSEATNKQALRNMFDSLLSEFPPNARQHVAELVFHNLQATAGLDNTNSFIAKGRQNSAGLRHLGTRDPVGSASWKHPTAQASNANTNRVRRQLATSRDLPKPDDAYDHRFDADEAQDDSFMRAADEEPAANEATESGVAKLRVDVKDVWNEKLEFIEKLRQVARSPQQKAMLYYTEELHKRRVQLEQLESSLGRAFAGLNRNAVCEKGDIDLHGLTFRQAAYALTYIFRKLTNAEWKCRREKLTIITGVGRHSKHNIPVLRPRVAALLRRRGVQFYEDGDGKMQVSVRQFVDSA